MICATPIRLPHVALLTPYYSPRATLAQNEWWLQSVPLTVKAISVAASLIALQAIREITAMFYPLVVICK